MKDLELYQKPLEGEVISQEEAEEALALMYILIRKIKYTLF